MDMLHAYGRGAYGRYHHGDRLVFPVAERSDRLRTKAVVTGVDLDGAIVCWDHAALATLAEARDEKQRAQPFEWKETVGGTALRLRFDPSAGVRC